MVSRWRRVLSQWCRGGVPVVSRRCNGPVPVVSRWCCSDVPVVFLWCLGVAVLVRSCPVCGWCPSGILVVCVPVCSWCPAFRACARFRRICDLGRSMPQSTFVLVSRRWCRGGVQRCSGGVPVSQWCPGRVSVVFQWCCGAWCGAIVFRWCRSGVPVAVVSSGVPVASRWCRGGVPVSQWCPSGAGVPSYLGACPDSVPAVFHPVVWCRDWLVSCW